MIPALRRDYQGAVDMDILNPWISRWDMRSTERESKYSAAPERTSGSQRRESNYVL
jgi:hypothetical protein